VLKRGGKGGEEKKVVVHFFPIRIVSAGFFARGRGKKHALLKKERRGRKKEGRRSSPF